ncbi:hypothetical protein OMK68_22125 [Rhodococcus pyridinivorans]|uniref:hypothetical protein n=1 Tax=Rhodococcus TaxID=1827 RepID=UPI0015866232|nr:MULTISPECIES: hypothetical protein [Rhodococcus]MBX4171731.1 hypothetical protein [Rhodococcus sp. DMU2021]MCW3472291.1 hypothetical protein [Rhodococcus pyridinivorans]
MPQAPHHPTPEGQAMMNLNVALLLLILMGGLGAVAVVQAALTHPTDRRGRRIGFHRHS